MFRHRGTKIRHYYWLTVSYPIFEGRSASTQATRNEFGGGIDYSVAPYFPPQARSLADSPGVTRMPLPPTSWKLRVFYCLWRRYGEFSPGIVVRPFTLCYKKQVKNNMVMSAFTIFYKMGFVWLLKNTVWRLRRALETWYVPLAWTSVASSRIHIIK